MTEDWDANRTWQIVNALTHNLVRDFQLHTGIATKKKNSRKRTARLLFRKMRTLRFEWIHLPARIARPQGRAELRIAAGGPGAGHRWPGSWTPWTHWTPLSG